MRVEIYGDAATNTVSGDTVQFTADDAIPVKSLEAQITPSIAGNQSVTITANGQTTEVSLEKTVYGGGVNVTTGLVTETHGGGAYDPSAVPADLASKIRSATTERSASGDVAAFSCTLGEFPMSAVSTTLTPTQDLHGYDRPWPGGGGANQWNEQWEVGGYRTDNGAKYADSSRIRTVGSIKCSPNTQYYAVTPTQLKVCYFDADDVFVQTVIVADGTFTTPTNAYSFVFCTNLTNYGTTYKNDIAINFPATVTTYSPYENICPITGHDTVSVWVHPTHDTTADPAATVQLGQTVYGGTLDVVSGEIIVNAAYEIVDPSRLSQSASIYIYNPSARMKSGNRLPGISSRFETVGGSDKFGARFGANNDRIYFYNLANIGITTLEEARTWFTANPTGLSYPLAEPITIQLTPTQVSTILGQNRVWSDGGGETSVTYRDGSLSNVSNIMTNSTALTTGENITYTLSQQRTYQIPGTVIRTVEGNNVMSANTGKITVTWSSPWFNITPWIAYQGLTFSRNDVDAPDAGRDMSGYMHRGRVGVKEKMNITTVQLTRAQSSILQTLLYPETIQVRVTPYPRTNAAHTMSMYTNNVKTTYVIHRANGEDLQSLTFPLIEN